MDDSVAALREELGLDPLGEDEDEDEDDEDESDSDRENEEEMMMRRANERAAQWAALPPPPKNELQPILQPGSTPIRDERRFLVWNSVGSIVSRSEDTFCALEFEFSNMSKHKTIRMTDHYRFTMAALGDRGALLASEGEQKEEFEFESDRKSKKKKNEEEDGRLLSTLYYRPFASWSHNSDWTQQLPKGERVICVALGDTWCAASTSENLTRVWRFSGLQDMVFANTDPVVSLAGHGQYFAIVTRSGSPSDSTQHLCYEILNIPERKKLVSGRLPMSKGSELEWLGFDDQGTLMMYESTGKLHGLYSVYGWKWVTLCDTSKLDSVKKSNGHHWVIGVSGGQLLTALCVNKTTFPSAFPKPVRGVHGVSLEYTLEHQTRTPTRRYRVPHLSQYPSLDPTSSPENLRRNGFEPHCFEVPTTMSRMMRSRRNSKSDLTRSVFNSCKSHARAIVSHVLWISLLVSS